VNEWSKEILMEDIIPYFKSQFLRFSEKFGEKHKNKLKN
jgi:hypothetical protein